MSLPRNRTSVLGDGLIHEWEEIWIIHQPYLLEKGYRLPSRYDPNWTPSWSGTTEKPSSCPDAMPMMRKEILDATRVSDGIRVVLKMVDVDRDVPILEYLSSPPLLQDTRNHTVPILDKFAMPSSNGLKMFIVMPLLVRLSVFYCPFNYASEVIDAVGQLLEGLEFMHEHGIAHRDACYLNLMVESTKLIPNGDFSLFKHGYSNDLRRVLEPVVRRSVGPLRYYFIDFETAIRYPVDDQNPKCVGIYGQTRNVPELSDTVPYNPFKLDVYQLGSIFPFLFNDYDGMEFFKPLHEAMTLPDPYRRPTAAEANNLFKQMCLSLTDPSQRVRLKGYHPPIKKQRSWLKVPRFWHFFVGKKSNGKQLLPSAAVS